LFRRTGKLKILCGLPASGPLRGTAVDAGGAGEGIQRGIGRK